ncbi:hypothetical protein PSA7680_03400 [Pseudoruegeria aquimaris]|uniref:Glycosyl transferase family 2 n=1 Tax=Pseudoruegeria aquimaris TaxID=393663 RepID=A0A1Y5THQ3_9RHOB|nr:hypothetical protein [Pseudoruegeria aquimaris]SLN64560.1 hypothetical protein PSA7680_03400 [Pseudoruegeria aquimaris]
MFYRDLKDFLRDGKAALAKGPVAMILVEDLVEVDTTIRHHQNAGFAQVLVFAPDELVLPPELEETVHRIRYDTHADGATQTAVNAVIAAAPGIWLYYCYNAEYLFYPFSETRSVAEMLAFHTEERRDAMLCYVVDLYAGDLTEHPNAVSLEDAYLDRSGYYALGRFRGRDSEPMERQLDFFGGLRWRFEEHEPFERRRIDRIALFRAAPGLELREDHTFNDEEYNTYACLWHHNLTAAICSFRTAKALRSNPGSRFEIHNFRWRNSTPFEWHSQQLMDLGLMEPGQWF